MLLGLAACTEVGPSISLQTTDRVVLIEEFTGVRCVNCPDGSDKITDLLNTYDGQLIAISIHGGAFSAPFPESRYDFRALDGLDLVRYLNAPDNEPIGYPAATVNRKKFPNEQNRTIFLNSWAGYISSELQQAPVVRIDLTGDFNPNTRELTVDTDLFFFEEVAGDVRLTVLITEDEIEDVQDSLDGKLPNYKHKHVLRDVLSGDYKGDLVGNGIAANYNTSRQLTYVLPADWNPEKCHVVAFVNRNDGGTLDVLQAAEAAL